MSTIPPSSAHQAPTIHDAIRILEDCELRANSPADRRAATRGLSAIRKPSPGRKPRADYATLFAEIKVGLQIGAYRSLTHAVERVRRRKGWNEKEAKNFEKWVSAAFHKESGIGFPDFLRAQSSNQEED